MDIIGRSYMIITSGIKELTSSVNKVTYQLKEGERETEGKVVYIQAGEALFIQNVCRH